MRKVALVVCLMVLPLAFWAWGPGLKGNHYCKRGTRRHVPASALAPRLVSDTVTGTCSGPIVNGGFEASPTALTGWTVMDEPDSAGTWFVQGGTNSPITGMPVAPPPQGNQAAMGDEDEPASSVLYQDFLVPPDAVLTFEMAYYNYAQTWVIPSPESLDVFGDFENQQIRVDLMDPSADPFDVGSGVLQNIFLPTPSTPYYSGYQTYAVNLGAYAGQVIRLRFAFPNNDDFLLMGVDNVQVCSSSFYDLSFQDDYGRSTLCVDSATGAWQYTVLKGNGAGQTYWGMGTIFTGSGYMRLTAAPGSGFGLTLIDYTTAHRATATFTYRPDAVSSALYDANTLDDTATCGGGTQPPPLG